MMDFNDVSTIFLIFSLNDGLLIAYAIFNDTIFAKLVHHVHAIIFDGCI